MMDANDIFLNEEQVSFIITRIDRFSKLMGEGKDLQVIKEGLASIKYTKEQ